MATMFGAPVLNLWEPLDLLGGQPQQQDEFPEDLFASLLYVEELVDMTRNYPDPLLLGSDLHAFPTDSPPSQLPWSIQATSASDVAKSPGDNSQHHSSDRSAAGNSSLSPGNSSAIHTPTSSLLDYNAPATGDEQDRLRQSDISSDESDTNLPSPSPRVDEGVSPVSATHTDDFVLVPYPRSADGPASIAVGRSMNNPSNRPPPATSSSGDSGYPAGTVPAIHSSLPTGLANAQWGSITSTSNPWMEGTTSGGHSDPSNVNSGYVYDNTSFASSNDFSSAELGAFDTFDAYDNAVLTNPFNNLPFRSADNGDQPFLQAHYVPGSRFNQNFPPSQQFANQPHAYLRQRQSQQLVGSQRSSMEDITAAGAHLGQTIPSTSSLLVEQPSTLSTAPTTMAPGFSPRLPAHPTLPSTRRQQASNTSSARTSPYPPPSQRPSPSAQTVQHPQQQQQQPHQHQLPHQHHHQSGSASPVGQDVVTGSSSRQLPALAAAETVVVPSNAPTSQPKRPSRGGRTKGSSLGPEAKERSHKMRGVTACWRCALQRDPCDEGEPCSRCVMKEHRGQPFYFECDRTKLPQFVHEFLPPSMTIMHQKQTIEDTVKNEVLQWDDKHPIDIYLSAGYGEPMRWTLYEFRPRTMDLLGQLQYTQDWNTNASKRLEKYSPPFGLMRLDSTDDNYFSDHLDLLMQKRYLVELGDTCFAEENLVDPGGFQARMLDLMCHLYLNTKDKMTREILQEVLRMMIITYIMGHTLCIVEETLPSVLSSIRHSQQPQQRHPYTSPRLANRQLKFYFHILRTNIYVKTLKWQQHVLRTAVRKDATWLPVFCAMLGFAMVLEEVQRTLQIQADAKLARNEMSYNSAHNEAKNACERIDKRFQLLIGLFQCKYRDRRWGSNGSFGNQTPELEDPLARDFLGQLLGLVRERRDHLASRKDIEYSPETQCFYTSRLVARFLLPFLDLPPSAS